MSRSHTRNLREAAKSSAGGTEDREGRKIGAGTNYKSADRAQTKWESGGKCIDRRNKRKENEGIQGKGNLQETRTSLTGERIAHGKPPGSSKRLEASRGSRLGGGVGLWFAALRGG